MTEPIKRLKELVDGSDNIVFFGGAGVSTESGIPDFRSADGLYNTSEEADPEYMLSADCLYKEPAKFYEYLREHMDFSKAEPNIAHRVISELQLTRTVSVITQNIDGLHEKAGSKAIANILVKSSLHRTKSNIFIAFGFTQRLNTTILKRDILFSTLNLVYKH